MSWIQTYTGKHFDLLDPQPEMVDIDDIAHALSLICRFNGHSRRFYSVAEHSVYVSHIVPMEYAITGLMHDASEAYIGDVTSPLKPFISNYKDIEDKIMRVLADKYSFVYPLPKEVHEADRIQLGAEAQKILTKVPEWFDPELDYSKGIPPVPMASNTAEYIFKMWFDRYVNGEKNVA